MLNGASLIWLRFSKSNLIIFKSQHSEFLRFTDLLILGITITCAANLEEIIIF